MRWTTSGGISRLFIFSILSRNSVLLDIHTLNSWSDLLEISSCLEIGLNQPSCCSEVTGFPCEDQDMVEG